MAWTAPLTAVSNATLTSAQWNASVRDNLLMTGPALATAAGNMFVSNGANSLAQRIPSSDTVNTQQSTTSTAYVTLTTPGATAASVVSDVRVIVWFTCQANNQTAAQESIASVAVSGATTTAADDNYCVDVQSASAASDITVARCVRLTVTAGTNTYQMQYRVTGGTGVFRRRSIVVLPF